MSAPTGVNMKLNEIRPILKEDSSSLRFKEQISRQQKKKGWTEEEMEARAARRSSVMKMPDAAEGGMVIFM